MAQILKEEWKDIQGHEDVYQVSNLGNVKSLNFNKTGKEKLLTAHKDKYGYLYACLRENNKNKKYKIHRLVAQAFIENPLKLVQVNHKDEEKTNNKVNNLEWCTAKYNVNYGSRTKNTYKEVYQYDLENNLVKKWLSIQECKREGFDNSAIVKCCKGKRKTHKGYIWSYECL